jgi:hypothetical protein
MMDEAEYIERDAVMDALLHEQYGYLCEDAIRSIPTADVVPVVRGKWEYQGQLVIAEEYPTYKCTVCGKIIPADWRKNCHYCPNCGADMREES